MQLRASTFEVFWFHAIRVSAQDARTRSPISRPSRLLKFVRTSVCQSVSGRSAIGSPSGAPPHVNQLMDFCSHTASACLTSRPGSRAPARKPVDHRAESLHEEVAGLPDAGWSIVSKAVRTAVACRIGHTPHGRMRSVLGCQWRRVRRVQRERSGQGSGLRRFLRGLRARSEYGDPFVRSCHRHPGGAGGRR